MPIAAPLKKHFSNSTVPDFVKLIGKNGGWKILFSPAILKGILSLKLENFVLKRNSENRFTFVQKHSEYTVKKQKKIDKSGKNLSFIACK